MGEKLGFSTLRRLADLDLATHFRLRAALTEK